MQPLILPPQLTLLSESVAGGSPLIDGENDIGVCNCSLWLNTPVPLNPSDIVDFKPVSGSWAGFTQDEINVNIQQQREYFTDEGDTFPSSVLVKAESMEISGRSVCFRGARGNQLRNFLLGNRTNSNGDIGKTTGAIAATGSMALIGEAVCDGKLVCVTMYRASSDAYQFTLNSRRETVASFTLKGLLAANKTYGVGRIIIL